VVITDYATAELVKVAANAFLATKISFINAVAEVCAAVGGDALHLTRALGYDSRVGPLHLQPRFGFGGGCLSKDIRAFRTRAEELGVGELPALLHGIDRINLWQRSRLVGLVVDMCGGNVVGRRIAALGVAFKPNTDDIRDSPRARGLHPPARSGCRDGDYRPEGHRERPPCLARLPALVYGHVVEGLPHRRFADVRGLVVTVAGVSSPGLASRPSECAAIPFPTLPDEATRAASAQHQRAGCPAGWVPVDRRS
jgi:UDPglucose 6-dehydrogenase